MAYLLQSPTQPCVTVPFVITSEGVRTLKEPEAKPELLLSERRLRPRTDSSPSEGMKVALLRHRDSLPGSTPTAGEYVGIGFETSTPPSAPIGVRSPLSPMPLSRLRLYRMLSSKKRERSSEARISTPTRLCECVVVH